MTVEQSPKNTGVFEARPDISVKSEPNILKKAGTEAFIKFIYPRVEKINQATEYEYPENFDEKVKQSVRDKDFIIIISSHDSLHNAQTIMYIAEKVTDLAREELGDPEAFKGFIIPYATSLATGHQSYFKRRISEVGEATINEHKLYSTLATRKKDTKDYQIEASPTDYIRNVNYALKNKYGLCFFPEGGMKKGRRDENGQQYGMQDLLPNSLSILISMAGRQKRNVSIIPVGITGDTKILPPDGLPSFAALRAGFGLGDPHLVDVKVGSPITAAEREDTLATSGNMAKEDQYNYLIGSRVASLLPENEQGIYRYHSELKPDQIAILKQIKEE